MEFIINSEISFSKSSQNTDFGHKITVIPLYQNDGYSLAEKEGFEFPQVITFYNKSSLYIHKYMRYRNFLVALLTTIYYPISPL